MNYDPHSGAQIRFERRDPTGRLSPISEASETHPWWLGIAAGIAMACVLALMIWAALILALIKWAEL